MEDKITNNCAMLPVDAGTLNTQDNAEVNTGPARLGRPAVTTHVIAGNRHQLG